MINVIQTIEGLEYKLRDAELDRTTGLWTGEVLGKGVVVGISSRLIRIVYFFKDEAAYDTYRREQGVASKTRDGGSLIN